MEEPKSEKGLYKKDESLFLRSTLGSVDSRILRGSGENQK